MFIYHILVCVVFFVGVGEGGRGWVFYVWVFLLTIFQDNTNNNLRIKNL